MVFSTLEIYYIDICNVRSFNVNTIEFNVVSVINTHCYSFGFEPFVWILLTNPKKPFPITLTCTAIQIVKWFSSQTRKYIVSFM